MKNPFRRTKAWPLGHPFVNPHYQPRRGGLRLFWADKRKGRATHQDISRWMPHSGAQEAARRLRQMEAHANGRR